MDNDTIRQGLPPPVCDIKDIQLTQLENNYLNILTADEKETFWILRRDQVGKLLFEYKLVELGSLPLNRRAGAVHVVPLIGTIMKWNADQFSAVYTAVIGDAFMPKETRVALVVGHFKPE